jgi:long-subunit acyl-CoA synthetase (AMP-forming)
VIRSASSSRAPILNGLETTFGVPVLETYGMTEAASQIAPIRSSCARSDRSAARPARDRDHGRGRPHARERRDGEIMLRGPT